MYRKKRSEKAIRERKKSKKRPKKKRTNREESKRTVRQQGPGTMSVARARARVSAHAVQPSLGG